MPGTRHIVGIDEAAEYIGSSVRHVRGLVHRRAIPHYKTGHYLKFDLADLDSWLDEHRVDVAS